LSGLISPLNLSKWPGKIMFTKEDTLKPVSTCEECQENFFDDGNELKHGRLLCETYTEYESEKNYFDNV